MHENLFFLFSLYIYEKETCLESVNSASRFIYKAFDHLPSIESFHCFNSTLNFFKWVGWCFGSILWFSLLKWVISKGAKDATFAPWNPFCHDI